MKSVSATNLSKMVFCEASVVRNARLSKDDRQRIAEGIRQHSIFENSLTGQALATSSTSRAPLIRLKKRRSSVMSPSLAILKKIKLVETTTNTNRPFLSITVPRILVSVFIITLVVVCNSL